MAAILTQAVVKTNTTNIFWIESPKFSKVGQQNQCGCKKSQTMVQYVFSMAAILKFKMAAGIVVENIGTKVFWIQHPKFTKVGQKNQCGCRKSQTMVPHGFSMAAILKLKMAAENVVENIGTKFFWIRHPKFIKVGQKNHLGCRKSQTMVPYRFSMAAILKFKMAAEDVVENIGTKFFWIQHP